MPQQSSGQKVRSQQQMIMALDLRASGASFQQIGKALSVSKPTSTAVPNLSSRAVHPVHFLLLLLKHRLSAFRVVKPKASLRRSPHDP